MDLWQGNAGITRDWSTYHASPLWVLEQSAVTSKNLDTHEKGVIFPPFFHWGFAQDTLVLVNAESDTAVMTPKEFEIAWYFLKIASQYCVCLNCDCTLSEERKSMTRPVWIGGERWQTVVYTLFCLFMFLNICLISWHTLSGSTINSKLFRKWMFGCPSYLLVSILFDGERRF